MNLRWLPEIRDIMSSVMFVAPETIQPETVPSDIPAWDSLSHLNLIVALEMQLGIRIGTADIDGMTSVGGICRVVAAKLGS